MIFALLAGIAISFIIYRLIYDGAPEGIPRVSKPGGIGYLIAALRYTIKSEEVLDEADKVFVGRPYALPTLGGWIIVLSAKHMETLRASNDSIVRVVWLHSFQTCVIHRPNQFNQPIQINEVGGLNRFNTERDPFMN